MQKIEMIDAVNDFTRVSRVTHFDLSQHINSTVYAPLKESRQNY